LGFYAPSANGPRTEGQILDVLLIEEADGQECLSHPYTVIGEQGSVLVYNLRVRLIDVPTLSAEPNSPETQSISTRSLDVFQLDVPLPLVLRGLPDWHKVEYSNYDELSSIWLGERFW
jgi:hypothetical protein